MIKLAKPKKNYKGLSIAKINQLFCLPITKNK